MTSRSPEPIKNPTYSNYVRGISVARIVQDSMGYEEPLPATAINTQPVGTGMDSNSTASTAADSKAINPEYIYSQIPQSGYLNFTNETSGVDTANMTSPAPLSGPLPIESQIVLIVFYTSAIVLSVVGNILVIIVFSCGKRSRTDLRGFLISLAIADLVMALFCMPFTFSSLMLRSWIFSEPMCPIVLFMQLTSVTASVCTNMAIGIDRFWVVTFPLRSRMTKSRYKIVISVIWVIATGLSSVQLYIGRLTFNPATGTQICNESWPSPHWRSGYTIFILVLTYLVPLLILTFTYAFVGRKLWQRTTPGNADEIRDTQQLKSKRKVIKMLVVVVVLFGVCWLPLHTFFLLLDFSTTISEMVTSRQELFNILYFAFHWIAMSNSFANPIIYGFMNDSFRVSYHTYRRIRSDDIKDLLPCGGANRRKDLQMLWVRWFPVSRCCLRRRRMGFSSSPSERMFTQVYLDNDRRTSMDSCSIRFDGNKKTLAVKMNGDACGRHNHESELSDRLIRHQSSRIRKQQFV
ncbi:QRFP-like peptide receptor [Tubulanus polymorphus]|uniref:QRFP-like peptide receptor n=1 Tax=Tubulanus polymorphus TaxID=672921 RepID=UPI003DA33B6F